MGILEDIQPLIEQVTNTTNPDEVIFYAVGFFKSEKNLEELSDEDCMQIIKKLIDVNSDAQLAAELAMVIAEKKGLYSFARKIVSDKSKYTGDDWSLTKFDEKRLEVLTFTTIHDPKNCPPEIIITYDEMIESDNPVRNGWDKIDWEAPKVQFFKGYYNGEYFEVGRVYEDPYEDDNGEIYYNSYYFELESFGGDDKNALENIIESINNSSYNSFESPFDIYQAKDDAELNVKINIHGRMHQLFQCTKEENEDMFEIDNHIQNIFDLIFKIDDDNFIVVEVDGDTVFKGNISELEIDSSNTEQGCDLSIPKRKYIEPSLEKIKQIKDFHDFDDDEILVSKKNNLMVVTQGRLDSDKGLEIAPNFNNRYTVYQYGKYHLETTIKLKRFTLSDLFFQQDPCMCDLIEEPSDGPFYSFSKIFHFSEGELKLLIVDSNVKATYVHKGWLLDF